jgi:hypothetical protein
MTPLAFALILANCGILVGYTEPVPAISKPATLSSLLCGGGVGEAFYTRIAQLKDFGDAKASNDILLRPVSWKGLVQKKELTVPRGGAFVSVSKLVRRDLIRTIITKAGVAFARPIRPEELRELRIKRSLISMFGSTQVIISSKQCQRGDKFYIESIELGGINGRIKAYFYLADEACAIQADLFVYVNKCRLPESGLTQDLARISIDVEVAVSLVGKETVLIGRYCLAGNRELQFPYSAQDIEIGNSVLDSILLLVVPN